MAYRHVEAPNHHQTLQTCLNLQIRWQHNRISCSGYMGMRLCWIPAEPRAHRHRFLQSLKLWLFHGWPLMAMDGHSWPCTAMHGRAWPCMAMNGHEWPYMAIYDIKWETSENQNFLKSLKSHLKSQKSHKMGKIPKSKFPKIHKKSSKIT